MTKHKYANIVYQEKCTPYMYQQEMYLCLTGGFVKIMQASEKCSRRIRDTYRNEGSNLACTPYLCQKNMIFTLRAYNFYTKLLRKICIK